MRNVWGSDCAAGVVLRVRGVLTSNRFFGRRLSDALIHRSRFRFFVPCGEVCSAAMSHLVEARNRQPRALTAHFLSDISHIPPFVFLYLIKEYYASGTAKAGAKFRALQHHVHHALQSSPLPGPATYVIECLYLLPIFGTYREGFSHLMISALRRSLKDNPADLEHAKDLAVHLFVDMVQGSADHDPRIVVKVVQVFHIGIENLENVLQQSEKAKCGALAFLEQYLVMLLESKSYMDAVALLEHFAIRKFGESFLLSMIEEKQFGPAEKWAEFMGKPMLSILVQQYVDRNMLNFAYQIIKDNNLQEEFPVVYHQCKESLLKKLAEKGCWDIAEQKAKGDKRLIEFLVYLALEAGYSEKVEEFCGRYSLQGFPTAEECDAAGPQSRYLRLMDLSVEEIIWVDQMAGLNHATCDITQARVIGLDCEWKPNFVQGSKPNKVSIMQIAIPRRVFIFDLLKLAEEASDALDSCFTQILQCPHILKLGYNFQCDIKQLASSYRTLGCFKHYDMLLDIQVIFKEKNGGLSGLAQKVLGIGLNKTRRNSNWENRPLTQNQLEYAAMDAAVLLHIFNHVQNQPRDITDKVGWKSRIISHTDSGSSKCKSGVQNKRTKS
ncbi:hypothetical protein MLD38_015605 [Melastoma candidum]|uniref:Uncharacterized protein n=1 Tax=Melastoma candidum TaxID=119954 RepID=A0ACB9RHT9_9MYRT|nr:hypothetical protein MLD38_015605 [Melastoma candidum]